MNYGWISCIPLAILIIGVLATKRMTESLLAASITAAVLVYRGKFITGYIELAYQALSNDAFQLLMITASLFGAMIALLEGSGALLGFRRKLEKICTSKQRTGFCVWLLGGIIFIDDYLNALAVSVSMKGISDKHKMPREHLAYIVNCMGACVCVMIPVSSWAAFAIGCLKDFNLTAADYYSAIPYMFYPICAILVCLLSSIGLFPKIGQIKRAYHRVEQTGEVLPLDSKASSLIKLPENTEQSESSIWCFLIPMLVLFTATIYFDNSIAAGLICSLTAMLIQYTVCKIMSVRKFIDLFSEGISSMSAMLFNICMAFMMQCANERMGFTNYVVGRFTKVMDPHLIPLFAFLIVGLTAFLAASFWTLIVITFPIFITMAFQAGINPSLVIAAIMSGVALGSQACLYSDAMFMVSAGTQVSNDIQFKSVLPYVGIGAILAGILFTIFGWIY